eukprot:TRINITY_DN6067_c0_g1_i2.p3 TRINITY_DN6067_c0_g1~~TRINITY_DN6067_c0_g1_i2.p3  ORF type:complete len:113 (-),score=38.29 TRINITY_DN6067_c0_g1_i2:103-441(-)
MNNEPDEENASEELQPEETKGSSKRVAGNSKSKAFQRVDVDILNKLPNELKNNSFHAKFQYGGGDDYGVQGHEKLKGKTGKGFRKEKAKLKNKNFQGGKGVKITYTVNSIKL